MASILTAIGTSDFGVSPRATGSTRSRRLKCLPSQPPVVQRSRGKLLDLARCRDGRSLNALSVGSFLGHTKGVTRSFAKVL
jgi:hypothetical protein